MANANRDRGFRFERKIVNDMKALGFSAKRAPGSDGRNIGMEKEVDVVIGLPSHPNSESLNLQAKKLKALNKKIIPDDAIHAQVVSVDRLHPLVIMRFDLFCKMAMRYLEQSNKEEGTKSEQ